MNKTKCILVMLYLFITQIITAQNYEQLISDAQNNIQVKDYCKALDKYGLAFKTTDGIAEKNPYTFYYAAISAIKCNDDTEKALIWLSEAQKNGLGSKAEDISYIENDSTFIKLHKFVEWNKIISSMKERTAEKQITENRLNKEWDASIKENVLNIKNKKKPNATPLFVLYFTEVKELKVPYLVYIPSKYDFKIPLKMIVYLHGGVVNTDKYNYDNYQLQQEPIFSIGENLNAIIVYPLGKKDFGWVNQQDAFDNIFSIVSQVRKRFKIDKKNIILGGMSNGGTATFYYASQKPNIFKGFFAISSNPNVLLSKIKFDNLSQGKKLITLNSKDDSVYNFKEVEDVYMKNKSIAKDWEFRSVNEGGHGFIYNPEKDNNILENVIKELLEK